jgi:hypothetical protein
MRNGFFRVTGVLAVLAAAAVMSGCLVKDTDTTITIRPDGSGTWTIVDRDVHSQADTLADRLREEQEYLADVWEGRYEPALALDAIGCSDVSTQVIRSQWPFLVITSCRFADLGALWQQWLDAAGLRGQSRLEVDGDRTTWSVWADTSDEAPAGTTTARGVRVDSLLGGDFPRLFLRHGQFVEATGFELADDRRVATLKAFDDKELEKAGGNLVLALTWTTTEAAKAWK